MNEDLPQLLRAIARGTQAQENKHDIVFNAAADEIERLRALIHEVIAAKRMPHEWVERRAG